MPSSRVGGLSVATMMTACVCAFAGVQEDGAGLAETWKLTAIVLNEVSPRREVPRMWLGITNATGEPRTICVRRVWYSIDREDTTGQGGTAEPVAVHSCGGRSDWHLLPNDTTYYLGVSLALDDSCGSRCELRFEVDLLESNPYTTAAAADVSVDWRGTLEDAARAGARLSNP